ncbi:hypothetical protein RHDE110596_07415 [Prescottella defluvii]|uniref:hypothetical protein n=1 Tax=Prescottella defluvii TaxID=1323361 RepID=UPI0004F2B677|nr:hypothetical protein [Prescottella defluvii]
MQPIECGSCGNRVLVEKFSPTHTSTQWVDDAESNCAEFRAQAEKGVPSMYVRTCHSLRDTIDAAVANGDIAESYRTVPVEGSTQEVRSYT